MKPKLIIVLSAVIAAVAFLQLASTVKQDDVHGRPINAANAQVAALSAQAETLSTRSANQRSLPGVAAAKANIQSASTSLQRSERFFNSGNVARRAGGAADRLRMRRGGDRDGRASQPTVARETVDSLQALVDSVTADLRLAKDAVARAEREHVRTVTEVSTAAKSLADALSSLQEDLQRLNADVRSGPDGMPVDLLASLVGILVGLSGMFLGWRQEHRGAVRHKMEIERLARLLTSGDRGGVRISAA